MLFFCMALFIREKTAGVYSPTSIAVIFNYGQSFHQSTTIFSVPSKKSLEKIPSTLGIDEKVKFHYKDMNSTFCDLGKFLLLMRLVTNASTVSDAVVLLLEDCQCEKKLLPFLDILNMKYVTHCEQPYLTVSVLCCFITIIVCTDCESQFFNALGIQFKLR